MADELSTPAVETETPAVTEEQPTVEETVETTETPESEADTPTVAELLAQIEAEKGKTAKAVKAEQNARARAAAAETELTGFRTAAETAEAERIANLSLAEQLAEERKKREAAEARAVQIEAQSAERQLEADLGEAGFLAGLEGEAKTSQLTKLKALTGLDLVKQDGAFSIDAFSTHFGALKPVVTPTTPAEPTVVDLGGKTPPPTEVKLNRKKELMTARQEAIDKGDRYGVMLIDGELSQLK